MYKAWDGIKTIVTLKAQAKAFLNSLTLSGHSIRNKISIVEIFNNYL